MGKTLDQLFDAYERGSVTRRDLMAAVASFVALGSTSLSAQPTSSGDDWGYHGIFHFTVEASNFERSLAFYQTLGFKLLRDNRDIVWPDYVATQFGLRRAQGRGALLALGEEEHHTRLDGGADRVDRAVRRRARLQLGAEQRAMKKSGVRRGVLVYKGPDPAAKMKIQV